MPICNRKECTHKGKEQPLENFFVHRRSKNGRQGHCKTCHKKEEKIRRERKKKEREDFFMIFM